MREETSEAMTRLFWTIENQQFNGVGAFSVQLWLVWLAFAELVVVTHNLWVPRVEKYGWQAT
jgi:hypothetical protein